MMDSAYFTSRKDILDWVNKLLGLSLIKIEQTCTGAVACQLLDYILPGSVNCTKVNWEAKHEYDYVANFKLLQSGFTKSNISKNVDVDKLVRGKYQDNLEFMQWFKAFFDSMAVTREEYDPLAVRSRGKGGKNAKKFLTDRAAEAGSKLLPGDRNTTRADGRKSQYSHASTAKESTTATTEKKAEAKPRAERADAVAKKPLKESSSANAPKTNTTVSTVKRTQSAKSERTPSSNSPTYDVAVVKELGDLKKDHAALQMTVEGLEKERDFYFDKLRDIEVMLQAFQERQATEGEGSGEGKALIGNVFKVLYATTDDAITVNDNGELVGSSEVVEIEQPIAAGEQPIAAGLAAEEAVVA
jgi:RP/EB family microtubule-associated protein